MEKKRKTDRVFFRVTPQMREIMEGKAAMIGVTPSDLCRMAVQNFCEAIGGELKPIEGVNGRGVVYLTDEQKNDLINKLGRDQFDHYVSRLAQFIIEKQAKLKNHYRYILEWYEADKPLRMEKDRIAKTKESKKRRYGNFDVVETHYNAIRRSFEEDGREDLFEKFYGEEYRAYMQSEERKEYEREMEERRKEPWKEFIN
jgi:hypothetical protein